MTAASSVPRFLVRTTALHVVTYLIIGVIASLLIDYENLFEQPVIRDYMRPFGSVAVFIGPVVQVVRGLIIAAVLLPFRRVIGERLGWLWLWLLLVGVGILSTSAAAPSSIEGVVYSMLPAWYHAIGLPEVLVQTLAFSAAVGFYERHPAGALAALPPVYSRIVRAIVVACVAFVGYALASVAFALAAGAAITADQNLTLAVQGVFVAPFVANAIIAFVAAGAPATLRRRAVAAAVSFVSGALAIGTYQAVVLGGFDPVYALVAPILPAIVVAALMPRRVAEPATQTLQ